jgi:dissimilatory sulfite reductase (desulfoviridin) alpha/beta subunit
MRITRVTIDGWDSLSNGKVELTGDIGYASFRLSQEQIDQIVAVVQPMLPGIYDGASAALADAKAETLALANAVSPT